MCINTFTDTAKSLMLRPGHDNTSTFGQDHIRIHLHNLSHTDIYSLTVVHRHTHIITSTQVNTHLVTHRHNHIHSQKRTHTSPALTQAYLHIH